MFLPPHCCKFCISHNPQHPRISTELQAIQTVLYQLLSQQRPSRELAHLPIAVPHLLQTDPIGPTTSPTTMFSFLGAVVFGGAGFFLQTSADFDLKKKEFLESLPEKTINQIAYEFDHPPDELIEQAKVVEVDRFGNELLQIPQQSTCVLNGVTAAFYHELVKASVRQQLEDDPHIKGICLSNIEDTQLFDTLIERSAEKRDTQGRVTQEAQYSLRRIEKPHDEQHLGLYLRIIDPSDLRHFNMETEQYICPPSRLKYGGYLPEHVIESIKAKHLSQTQVQRSLKPHDKSIRKGSSALLPVPISDEEMRKHSEAFIRPQNFEGIMSLEEHQAQMERSRQRRLMQQFYTVMGYYDDDDDDDDYDDEDDEDDEDEVPREGDEAAKWKQFHKDRYREYSGLIDETDDENFGLHEDDWFLDEDIRIDFDDHEAKDQPEPAPKPRPTAQGLRDYVQNVVTKYAQQGSRPNSQKESQPNHEPNDRALRARRTLDLLGADYHGEDMAARYAAPNKDPFHGQRRNKNPNEIFVDENDNPIIDHNRGYWDTDDEEYERNKSTTPRPLHTHDPERRQKQLDRDFLFPEQTVHMDKEELYFDQQNGDEADVEDFHLSTHNDSPHLPKHPKDFPECFLTIPRKQLNYDDLFLPHTTHLSITPNSELENVLKDGNMWAKIGKERLVGLKRVESIIPTLKPITVIGEIYRDYDDALKVRSAYDPRYHMFYSPEITYKTRYELIQELDGSEEKKRYGAYGCYSAASIFAFNFITTIGSSLVRD